MVQQLRDEQKQEHGELEDSSGRNASPVEMHGLHPGGSLTCADCKHCTAGWFLTCRVYDKPTSGEINNCPDFERR